MIPAFCALRGTRGWLCLLFIALFAGPIPLKAAEAFTRTDLEKVYVQAADRARELSFDAVIAVVDRDGRALLVRRASGSAAVSGTERAIAVAKAGTAVFLSSNEHAFSSRTAGFIIQPRFPPRVRNRPPGPLVGVGFSNLAFSDINYFRELDGSRIPGTRLYASPGGVPLYKNGVLLAGIGVTGDGTEQEDETIRGADNDEAVALAGQIGYAPKADILGTDVLIDGIRLTYTATDARAAAQASGTTLDSAMPAPPAPVTWPTAVLGGVLGEVRAPIRADPAAGTINGQPRLTADEVRTILANAAARTRVTRAGIRLPGGKAAQVFIAVVSNPAQDGQPPAVLGTFRTPDATVFSWDVAVQKARTAIFFSSHTRAYSSRTVGFLAQPNYPPGMENQPPGLFNGLQERFAVPILTGTGTINGNLPNGITIFPGGFPLYRNGVLIGAIGISGDGIEQDDLIGASGTIGFQPAATIRADNFAYLMARLPYAKFPRNPELQPAVAPVPDGFAGAAAESAPGSLLNLSARGWVGPGGPLILGFVTEGAASAPLLVRGAGPALGELGVSDPLARPSFTLNDSTGRALASNAGWSETPDSAAIAQAAARTGAFPFRSGSADAALLTSPTGGAYTMVLGGRDGATGTALAEVYDATTAGPAERLKNVSIRGRIEGSTRMLIAGLVVAEGGPRTVLIRGIGPALAAYGVSSPLAHPRLTLFNSAGERVAEGAPWAAGSNAGEIGTVATTVGAFPLAATATDPVLLVTLAAGAYTIQVSAPEGESGEALSEVYTLP